MQRQTRRATRRATRVPSTTLFRSAALTRINRAAEEAEEAVHKATEPIAVADARRAALERQIRQADERIARLERQQAEMADRRAELARSAEHTSELQSLMRTSYAVVFLENSTAPKPGPSTQNV